MGSSSNKEPKLKKIKTINTEVKKGLYDNKICEIKKGDITGLGFFCKIESPDSKEIIPVLITNYQLIGDLEIINKKIEFILNGKTYTLDIDDSRRYYLNEELYNTTIIEIKKEDKLDIDSFFEIQIDNNKKDIDIDYLGRQSIVLIDKNNSNKFDIFKIRVITFNKDSYKLKYSCLLNKKSCGSPLLNVDSNKIIGINSQYINLLSSENVAVLFKNLINEFNTKNKKIKDNYKLDENKKNNLKESLKLSKVNTIKSVHTQDMKNEIILTYLIPDEYDSIKIFGEKFVKNNIDKFYFLIQNEKTQTFSDYDLGMFIKINNIPNFNDNMKILRIILIQIDYVYDLSDMFYGCDCLLEVEDINKLNTERVTNMASMFEGCKLLSDLYDIKDLNVSNVKDMSLMFDRCLNLKSLDLTGWKTKNVKSFKGIFESCELLKEIRGLSDWDVSNLKDSSFMFNFCKSLNEIPDISNWNISNISDMSCMFKGCNKIKKLPDISKWNTKNVKLLTGLFCHCINLESLPDLSKWDTSNVENISEMFNHCGKLKNIPDISKWNTSNVISMKFLFSNCSLLTMDFFLDVKL